MHIRSLEITGFKSFGDRVVLAFDRGISAIVGPNGCGKSNIVDAIRWVMGEQNPRQLRGRGMDDVIFAGTETKPAVGMAEVSITFDNSDGSAPAPYHEFAEIQIGRRLFRSGESEYLINKVPCRLRDVTDFFLDTGIGLRGYTIVEQGKIAELVSTKPEERRFIFEEAAGISKYRQRRLESERKLAATEQNLLRVTDILGELRRQINSLDRQASRAKRYKELSAQQRELELVVRWEEHQSECEALSASEQRMDAERATSVELDARVSRAESFLEGERRSHLDRERELQSSSEQLFELRSSIQSLENRTEWERREQAELARLIEERSAEVEELEGQLGDHNASLSLVLTDLAAADESLARDSESLEEREVSMRALAQDLAVLQGRRDSMQAQLVTLSADAAALESRCESVEQRRGEFETGLRENETALEAILQQAEGFRSDEQSLEQRLRDALGEKDDLGRRLAELLGDHDRASERQETERLAHARAREFLQQVTARLETLRETDRDENRRISQTLESLPDRARAAVRGVLSDVLRVDDGVEGALEAVLAGRLESVLVDDARSGLQLLTELRKEGAGRATALPLGAPRESFDTGIVPLGRPLSDFVRADEPYRGAVDRLLRGVYLVDDLAEAVERFGATDPPALFVTREGELLDRSGALTGGLGAPAGAISRASEMRRAELELLDLEAEVTATELRASSEQARVVELGSKIENVRNRHHTADLAVVNVEKDLERARERGKAALESGEAHRASRAVQLSQIERLLAEIEASKQSLSDVRDQRRSADLGRDDLSSEIARVSRDLERLEQRLVQARVELAERAARADQLRERRLSFEAQISESRDWLDRRREEIERANQRSSSLSKSSLEAEAELADKIRSEEALRTAQNSIREQFEQTSRTVEELTSEAREASAGRDEVRERLQRCELQLQEIRLRTEQLCERIMERYGLDLSRYEPPEDHRDGDSAEREASLQKITRSLDSLGPVSLGSIEEYEEVSERHRYLDEQKADLELSIERLRSGIARINRTSRQRFRETFEAVNEEFKQTFPRMFQGGRAHLGLTESEDVLEAGIEITAQPPGKRLQNVNLLSGGEKALTAIALLMSVFAVKPSPFFLLDEVDAALDDANVGRFDELLRERSADSQFLVITHNKASIESADTLFGVTMQEPGLTRLVTVNLVDVDDAI